MGIRGIVKRILVFLFMLVAISFADTVFYNSDYKLINCQIIDDKENEYIVKTVTKNGLSSMNISKSIVNVIEYSVFDSTALSEIIKISKTDDINITKLNREKRENIIEQKKMIKEEMKINNERLALEKNYYYKTNIPMLATGVALTTLGINNLVAALKANKSLNELREIGDIPESLEDEYKALVIKSYLNSAIFIITGGINFNFAFEKVAIVVDGKGLGVSYDF